MHRTASMVVTAAIGLVVVVLVLSMTLGCFYTVDQTQRGVILRNGAVAGIAQPGFGWKMPMIDSVEKISVKNELLRWKDLEGYSHDQQAAHYMISVNYQINPNKVGQIYADFGGVDGAVARLITPNVLKQSKIVIGRFTAQSTIQERARLNNEIAFAIDASVSGGPLTITGVQVEDIKFSAAYEKSIEERMLAEVEVLRLRQNAEREKVQAQITVTKAAAEADATRAKAQADGDTIRIRGEAEAASTRVKGDAYAAALRARSEAMKGNQDLIALMQAERWNGQLPTTMVPNSALPMLNLGH